MPSRVALKAMPFQKAVNLPDFNMNSEHLYLTLFSYMFYTIALVSAIMPTNPDPPLHKFSILYFN